MNYMYSIASPDIAAKNGSDQPVELRTGEPYARLISQHQLFATRVAGCFGLNPQAVIPTYGTTGAIEAVRNHVFRIVFKSRPTLLTVNPGYWRAREAFQGFGFQVITLDTEPFQFDIREDALIEKSLKTSPDILYLSLPNNPTGATFDPCNLIAGISPHTAIMLDLTLPSSGLDTVMLTKNLYRQFAGRRGLFLIGSTSKAQETAEFRIGWVICANEEDAHSLREENRNVLSTFAVEHAIPRLGTYPVVLERIRECFEMLKADCEQCRFELIRPASRVETGYALVRHFWDISHLRETVLQHGIRVMWGSEFGLSDHYMRLETTAPAHMRAFLTAIQKSREKVFPAAR